MADPTSQNTEFRTPYQQRRDVIAKALAASIMGLVKDATGSNLPDEIIRKLQTKADAMIFIISSGADHDEAGKELARALEGYHGPG